jgi:Protein of unknown function (DUF2752)
MNATPAESVAASATTSAKLSDPQSLKRSGEHWIVLVGSTSSLLLLVAFALWVEPDPRGFGTHEKLGMPPCAAMQLWGVPCPGCGVTTSFALAAHGHLVASFVNQPLGCAIALAVPLVFGWAWVQHARGRDLWNEQRRPRNVAWAIGIVLFAAAAWIYKIARVRGWIA